MSSLVIAIFLLSIGASFVQRTTGFGFGIFIMTMLPFFLPTYGEATTLSGLISPVGRKHVERHVKFARWKMMKMMKMIECLWEEMIYIQQPV